MEELLDRLKKLQDKIKQAYRQLRINEKEANLLELQRLISAEDFWRDKEQAQDIASKAARLERLISPWLELKEDTEELIALAETRDKSLEKEIKAGLAELKRRYASLSRALKFSQEHDAGNAIVSIQAGAGGADAQDWVAMLLRMYTRWAQKHSFTVKVLDQAPADVGYKHVSIKIEGDYAYGWLRSEHGVHRLVRKSPFNSAHSRETSFAMVEVLPELDETEDIKLDAKDLKIDVFRAGGHGGQSVNTTDSAVRVTHLPTSLSVTIQNERSQSKNKQLALSILKSKLYQLAKAKRVKRLDELRGEKAAIAWGSQIRNYILHPYKLVKDLRTGFSTTNVDAVLDGELDDFMTAYLSAPPSR